jgi:hypothetical protein
MARDLSPWSHPVRFGEIGRGLTLELAADAAARERIARTVGVDALLELTASLALQPWLDGAQLTGRFHARVEQTCGVTLEPFEQRLEGGLDVRLVPAGSPNAPEEGREVALDPEAPDPPDVVDDAIDLGGYLVEHLALEVDPFPRKPDAVFEPPPDESPASPFAVLKGLKGGDQPR